MCNEKIVDKIRKLFALAGNNPSEAEADLAMTMARKLLDKHSLSMSDLADTSGEVDEELLNIPSTEWARMLCYSIAKLYDAQVLLRTMRRGQRAKLFIIGNEANRVTATIVIESVLAQIQRKAKGKGNSFRVGASYGVSLQVDRIIAERADQEVVVGTGLLPIDLTTKAMRDIDEFLSNIANLSYHTSKMRNASREGVNFGSNVSLSPRVGGSSNAQLALA